MKYTAIPVIKLEIFVSYTYHPVIININPETNLQKNGNFVTSNIPTPTKTI